MWPVCSTLYILENNSDLTLGCQAQYQSSFGHNIANYILLDRSELRTFIFYNAPMNQASERIAIATEKQTPLDNNYHRRRRIM
jgi:hypothetical protein